MPIFKRRSFQIHYKCHFTSYWRYCFLHSGVMWDERCSANFILSEQVSPQTSVKSESGCPLPRRRDFCYFSQLAGSTCGASARRTPLLFTPLLARPGQCTPSGSRPTYYFTGGTAVATVSLFNSWTDGSLTEPSLIDFAPSLPGQVWGHCGPPSHWATATWLRQQSAQWHRLLLGPPMKKCWRCAQGTPHVLHRPFRPQTPISIRFLSHASVWATCCPLISVCNKIDGILEKCSNIIWNADLKLTLAANSAKSINKECRLLLHTMIACPNLWYSPSRLVNMAYILFHRVSVPAWTLPQLVWMWVSEL